MREIATSEKPLVLFGTGLLAERARYYFEAGGYRVVAFTVDARHRTEATFHGLPLIAFESLPEALNPATHALFACVGYKDRNITRERVYIKGQEMGFASASCVANSAILNDTQIGGNTLIMDNTSIGPYSEVGRGLIMGPGAVVSHHTRVGNFTYISSNASVSGCCDIGNRVFIGTGASIADGVAIADGTFIGIGAVVTKPIAQAGVYVGCPARPIKLDED